jgi:uncharacterized protein (DUF433 family)
MTRREAAELSGTSLAAVNKAIEQKVLRPRRGGARSRLAPEDVGSLALLGQLRFALPVATKQRLAEWARSRPGTGAELHLNGALLVRMPPEVEQGVQRALRYVELRERLVEINPAVCGGEPVIVKSRVPVRGLGRQIELGETREVLREDFWFLPEEAFELAPLWARANPRKGRPSRPWVAGERTPVARPTGRAQAA